MIISQTPYRVSFAGGGTDLPAFYTREPGAVLGPLAWRHDVLDRQLPRRDPTVFAAPAGPLLDLSPDARRDRHQLGLPGVDQPLQMVGRRGIHRALQRQHLRPISRGQPAARLQPGVQLLQSSELLGRRGGELVHLRGGGRFLIATETPPVAVDVSQDAPLRMPLAALVGWVGNLTPRVVPLVEGDESGPAAVELTGDGRVLADPDAAAGMGREE